MSDQLGRVLGGRYRLVAAIGTGASAQVFLADDTTLRRRVAVKVLHPALAADEAFLHRFRAEARAAAALSHPNVMAVYDWGEDDGPYLVLEHLGGGSLRALLDRGARLTPSQALVVGLEAARALDVAHRRGFVHRDIKPANLLFGEDGRLRIADFGLARALSEAGWTEPGDGLVGTARYAAPEQALGGRVDGKADVYALALVLIEAVTGSVPLTSGEGALQTMMARQETPVPVPEAMGPLVSILERMGRPDPAERPDAAEVGRALVVAARDMARPGPLPLTGHDVAQPADDITVFPDDVVGTRFRGDDVTVVHRTDETGVLPPVPTAAPGSRRHRLRWVVALLVASALVGGGGAFAWTRLRVPSAALPVVANLPIDQATQKIAAADQAATKVAWKTRIVRQYDDAVAADIVIRTKPTGASMVHDGSTITLWVSLGAHPVPVPNLAHATVEAASAALTQAQLKLGKVNPVYDENEPKGQVMGWSVGTTREPPQAPKGSSVDLTVSNGPPPRTIDDLKNAPLADAENDLTKQGLKFTVVQEFSDDIDSGKVTRTNPPAGATANKGDTVTIYVSKGKDLVTVPDVSKYRTLDEATAALEAAGLQLGAVSGHGTRPAASDPSAGTKVKRGTSVDIFLTR